MRYLVKLDIYVKGRQQKIDERVPGVCFLKFTHKLPGRNFQRKRRLRKFVRRDVIVRKFDFSQSTFSLLGVVRRRRRVTPLGVDGDVVGLKRRQLVDATRRQTRHRRCGVQRQLRQKNADVTILRKCK